MFARRFVRAAAVGLICFLLAGCMLADAGRNMWQETVKIFTPNPRGYNDGIDEVDPNWSSWDKQASGLRPMEQGGDPLFSPKARQIERNLGVE